MHIVIIVLSVLAAVIALLLIIALFMDKAYKTHREILINTSQRKAFDYIKFIRNQDNYNKWIMIDPGMKKEYKGTDGTVGFIYAWNGNKEGGEGEQEIKAITEDKNVEMEIRFVRPFAGVATAKMATEAIGENQTKVIWNTASDMKYPFNIMLPMIKGMLEKDMGTSLATLKGILEK